MASLVFVELWELAHGVRWFEAYLVDAFDCGDEARRDVGHDQPHNVFLVSFGNST
jgi:hypothetical protein